MKAEIKVGGAGHEGEIALDSPESMVLAFWCGAGVLLAVLLYFFASAPSWRVIGGAAIIAAALVPVYFWCSNRIPGVPIFPVFSLTFVPTYAYPLVSGHPIVVQYSETAALAAGLTIALFLCVATMAWYAAVRFREERVVVVRAMEPGRGDYLFSGILLAAALLTFSVSGEWFALPAGVFSIIRAALFGLSSVGVFVLSYRFGRRELEPGAKAAYAIALTAYLVSQLMTIFLVSTIVTAVLAMAAFIFGRRELPWRVALVAVCVFSLLHSGKSEMRSIYWYPEPVQLQPWHFPVVMGQWVAAGVQNLAAPDSREESEPLYERLSLAHLLLKVQDESPQRIPYLYGETYWIIPHLLVPRVLNPEKLAAHEGTTLLNVHYGLQTRAETESTTIGWGLVNEAMANFGYIGIAVLALVLGGAYGWVTRYALGMPVLSLPMLVAVTFLAFATQTEFTAGVYVSALFQSLASLVALGFVFMSPQVAAGAGVR